VDVVLGVARHESAPDLAAELRAIPNVEIVRSVDANMLFVSLPDPLRGRFDAAGYVAEKRPDLGPDVIRLLTHWSTTETDVQSLITVLTGS